MICLKLANKTMEEDDKYLRHAKLACLKYLEKLQCYCSYH